MLSMGEGGGADRGLTSCAWPRRSGGRRREDKVINATQCRQEEEEEEGDLEVKASQNVIVDLSGQVGGIPRVPPHAQKRMVGK